MNHSKKIVTSIALGLSLFAQVAAAQTVTAQGAVTVPSGCQAGFLYNVTNGQKCALPVSGVVGCRSDFAYSPITGQKCSVTPVTMTVPASGPRQIVGQPASVPASAPAAIPAPVKVVQSPIPTTTPTPTGTQTPTPTSVFTFVKGKTYPITWSKVAKYPTSVLLINKTGAIVTTIVEYAPHPSNSVSWTVSTSLPNMNDARIVVRQQVPGDDSSALHVLSISGYVRVMSAPSNGASVTDFFRSLVN